MDQDSRSTAALERPFFLCPRRRHPARRKSACAAPADSLDIARSTGDKSRRDRPTHRRAARGTREVECRTRIERLRPAEQSILSTIARQQVGQVGNADLARHEHLQPTFVDAVQVAEACSSTPGSSAMPPLSFQQRDTGSKLRILSSRSIHHGEVVRDVSSLRCGRGGDSLEGASVTRFVGRARPASVRRIPSCPSARRG